MNQMERIIGRVLMDEFTDGQNRRRAKAIAEALRRAELQLAIDREEPTEASA